MNAPAQISAPARRQAGGTHIPRTDAVRCEIMRLAAQLTADSMAAQLPVEQMLEATISALMALLRGTRRYEPRPLAELALRYVADMRARAGRSA